MMLPQEVIRRKRNGEDLSRELVKEFIEGLTKGTDAPRTFRMPISFVRCSAI